MIGLPGLPVALNCHGWWLSLVQPAGGGSQPKPASEAGAAARARPGTEAWARAAPEDCGQTPLACAPAAAPIAIITVISYRRPSRRGVCSVLGTMNKRNSAFGDKAWGSRTQLGERDRHATWQRVVGVAVL